MKLSCYLIGEDSLLIQCGNILLARNHFIDLVITPIKSIQIWAKNNFIPWISSLDQLPVGQEGVVDIIFSIVNSCILTPELLKMAKLGVFNYHDSILPHYAGLNATIWALIHNERRHGITWHLVNEHIDKGDIVNQRIVPIQTNETALSLNLRCYEEAIHGFKELLAGIETNSLRYHKQMPNAGSTYNKQSVLPDLGFINWKTTSAECIERLSRALSLEYYNNSVGQLKLALPNNYLIVSQIEIIPKGNPDNKASGVILAMDKGSLVIAVGTKAVRIGSFTSARGKTITLTDLQKKYHIAVGYQCPYLENRSLEEVDTLVRAALHSEKFWAQKLQNMQDHSTFSAVFWNKKTRLRKACSVQLGQHGVIHTQLLLLTTILVYLYRLNNYQETSLFLLHEEQSAKATNLAYLFSAHLPLFVNFSKMSFADAALAIDQQLTLIKSKGHYLADIFARYPSLSKLNLDGCISLSLSPVSSQLMEHSLLHFEVDAIRGQIVIYHRITGSDQSKRVGLLMTNMELHLQSLIQSIMENPATPIQHCQFLTTAERQQLAIWSQGETKSLPSDSIITLFEQQVRQSPHSTAIYFQNETITYEQLAKQVTQVACYLQTLALPAQSFIGVFMPRSVEMLVVVLAILKTQLVFVPLDVKCPAHKMQTIVQKARLKHIISAKGSDVLQSEDYSVHVIEKIMTAIVAPFVQPNPRMNSLAYVMFTSGTTGAPKGVKVSEKNVINYCDWFVNTNQFNTDSIIDFSSSIAFDLSIPCTIAPLITGGSLAIAEDKQKLDPELYLRYLQQYKVTHAELTPSYVKMLLHYPEEIQHLTDLRYLLLGADDVRSEEVAEWLSLCPSHQVVNEYGPTEATVSVTSFHVSQADLFTEATVPIGKPGFNSSCYVFDAQGNLCPIGMKGELHIGGNQVAEGYLDNEELTEKQFVRLDIDGVEQVVYKTGDLVCWLPDGNLQFFGRNDQQVKIQGYRIELPAIESVLMKLEGIHQAIVVVKQGLMNEKYIRAYCVPCKHAPSVQEIKEFLAIYLPLYMHPKEFFMVSSIPLLENEKIDYVGLEQQAKDIKLVQQEYIEYQDSATEAVCRSIWQQAFFVQGLSVDEDFFTLGGDSLIALQIISALKKQFQKNMPLSLLFEFPTIRSLAAKIDSLTKEEELASSLTLVKLSQGTSPIPLFLVHPLGGSVFWYQQLAQILDGKYTIYGIQDNNFDGTGPRFKTLEAMASYYLSELSKIYTGDSYCLGGASFGATVAFAMADQLIKSGKTVEFLGLFDGWAHYPASIMRSEKDKYDDSLKDQEDYRKSLLLNYKLPVLKTDITLFKAQELWEPFSQINDEFNGWRPYVDGNIHIVLTPGTHETMFYMPNVMEWADLV